MSSEDFFIDKDIKALCVTASSFPEGVEQAHKKLRSMVRSSDHRSFYGISFSDKDGNIIYKAATEELYDGEGDAAQLEIFVIRKGRYIGELLKKWRENEGLIGKTFQKLLADPRIDRKGYCLEIYVNETDMKCLVLLDTAYSPKQATSGDK